MSAGRGDAGTPSRVWARLHPPGRGEAQSWKWLRGRVPELGVKTWKFRLGRWERGGSGRCRLGAEPQCLGHIYLYFLISSLEVRAGCAPVAPPGGHR